MLTFISLQCCLYTGINKGQSPALSKIFIINHTPSPLLYKVVKYGFLIPKYVIEPGQTKMEKIPHSMVCDFVCQQPKKPKIWARIVLLNNDATVHIKDIEKPAIHVTYENLPTPEEVDNNEFILNLFHKVFKQNR